MLNFDDNHLIYDPTKLLDIKRKVHFDGFVQIQFNENDFPGEKSMEEFFVDFIKQIGGQCLEHNDEKNSFVWHIQPIDKGPNVARSHTDDEFPFHTDCSFEMNPPEFMALFVLEPDQFGGGIFEIIRVTDIVKRLSPGTKEFLQRKKFPIRIPMEFRKSPEIDRIDASIFLDDDRIRYRSDIIGDEYRSIFNEFDSAINEVDRYRPKFSRFSMIILNNQKFLHGRTKIVDQRRHLLRIRFNRSIPFDTSSVYPLEKLQENYLTFSNDFAEFLSEKHRNLEKILRQIVFHYDRSTSIGEEIRRTFQFNEKIDRILRDLNEHRPNYRMGSYRPDLLISEGNSFRFNGKFSFQPKICEINARFPFNGYFLSADLCSKDRENLLSTHFDHLIEDLIDLSQFNREKPMFIVKGKENGFDIHLFHQYWTRTTSQQCFFLHPNDLQVQNEDLFDVKTNLIIEQFVLELHQEEILNLSDEILRVLIENRHLNYFNDLRTIFLLHDKRLFSLLSNEQFLDALLDGEFSSISLGDLIPKTLVIEQIPNYLKDSIINHRENWLIKPNDAGKGENVSLGIDVTLDQWFEELNNENHRQWILQKFHKFREYQSMNLVGMLICFNDRSYQMGIIRMSPKKIVNICHGGSFIRCFIPRQFQHLTTNSNGILNKIELNHQLQSMKSIDSHWNKNVYFSSSGGTGGKRLFFATDIRENRLQREILVDLMLNEEILCSDDVSLNLFQSNEIYRSMEIFNEFCSMANATSIPLGATSSNEMTVEIIDYFHPNVLMGTPHRLMQLALFINQISPRKRIQFEKIFFAGESLDSNKRKYLEEIFQCPTILGFYGSAESGVFACQSKFYSSTKLYLYPKRLVQIEIDHSNILVTNLIRRRNQLIRFNTGDQGRICSYEKNENFGLLEVFRSERLILIGHNTLAKSDIEIVMEQFPFFEWQLIIEKMSDEILLRFRFHFNDEEISLDKIQNRIEQQLDQCFEEKLSHHSDQIRYQFELISMKDFIRNETSNKLVKIIDRRCFQC